MLFRRGVDRLAQGDGFQVVAAADLWLAVLFEGTQELRHRADKGVGEPHLLPARLMPARSGARREIEGTRRAGGIARPANGAAGLALGPLDAPADADVGGGSLARRPRPDVVPAAGPTSAGIFE